MNQIAVPITLLPHARGLPLPAYATQQAAGIDLLAAVTDPLDLLPAAIALVPCGFCMALPPGHEAQVRPRSGLASRHGITLVNSPGTIDADYRGEVQVPLINLGPLTFRIERGMRIAQMVIAPVLRATLHPVDQLDPTPRGSGGFGHTGV